MGGPVRDTAPMCTLDAALALASLFLPTPASNSVPELCWAAPWAPTRAPLGDPQDSTGAAETSEGLGDDFDTVAESSDYEATSTHAEVLSLIERLDAIAPHLEVLEMGRSHEDRAIPLMVFADPPISSAEAARASGKTRIYLFGNIHAGEVCGKEALLQLARELARDPKHPWLDGQVLLIAPIYNPDGNERMSKTNRPGQVGPVRGMGQRPNAQGLDLNRDHVKLESPEARAQVRLLTEWDPHLCVDTHTTNGSYIRYHLTYAAPLNPSGYTPSIELVRDRLLPEVSESLLERTEYHTTFYGNFQGRHKGWATYSSEPRFGGPYRGLRGQMSVLSEAYAYVTYEERVLATREFCREIIDWVQAHGDEVRATHDEARERVTEAGRHPQPDDLVGIRHRVAAFPRPTTIRGYVEEPDESGRMRPSGEETEYEVVNLGRFEATKSVLRPHAYLLGPGQEKAIENLRLHGVTVEAFEGTALVEVQRIDDIQRRSRPFQGHRNVTVETTSRLIEQSFPEGTSLVSTAQPLGNLIVYLLEPESQDGLTTWNFFDDDLIEGQDHPVVRLRSSHDLR